MNTETLEEPQGYEQEFETIQITHAQHGDIQFEAPIGMSDEEVKTEFGKLDLDLLLGLEQVNETEVGETQVEKLKEFENSAGAGRKDGKWYGHESLEGGTQTIAYGHKLTPEEAKSGFISINGELVDYRQGLSQDHAEAVLKADTQWAQTHASASLKKIGMEEDEGKLQAITSLIYNVGSGSWGSSKAKKFLEAGNIEDFMHEAFSEEAGFVNINGEYSRGLARRRKEEAGLFAQANINEGSPFSKMISEVLNTINPISTAQAADDPKGLPLPTQAESDAATAAAEPPKEATGAPVDLTTPLNTPEATGDPVDLTTPLNRQEPELEKEFKEVTVPELEKEFKEVTVPEMVKDPEAPAIPVGLPELRKPLTEADNIVVSPAPTRLLAASFLPRNWGASMTFGDNDVDVGARKVINSVYQQAKAVQGTQTPYEYYPELANGLSAKAAVGDATKWDYEKNDYVRDANGRPKMFDDVRAKLAAERKAAWPKGNTDILKQMYYDPVARAVFTVGRFSIQSDGKGNEYIAERWNFNASSNTSGDSFADLRNTLSNLPTAPIKEDEGALVALLLSGKLTTDEIEALYKGK